MKIIPLFAGIFLASCSNAQQMNNGTFTSERVAKTATILLNDRVDKVFPSAEITYSFTGLNEIGNQINEHFLSIIYQHNLSDWAADINHYLAAPH